ncbi:hypothetical protein [Atopobium minutum]|uniref:hypothetical protein n=1 Tax=Atopobium minutum TaxID=1381 RepID=UPI000AE621D9
MAEMPIKRALVSVTDKTGVVEFVKTLETEFGVEVISTGAPRVFWQRLALPLRL